MIDIPSKALNRFLDLLDQRLDAHADVTTAIFRSGEQLKAQYETNKTLFHPYDFYHTMDAVNTLLRRSPEFKQREKGWNKSA